MTEIANQKADIVDQWWKRFAATFLATFVLIIIAVDAYKDVPSDWERCFQHTMEVVDRRHALSEKGQPVTERERISAELLVAQWCGGASTQR